MISYPVRIWLLQGLMATGFVCVVLLFDRAEAVGAYVFNLKNGGQIIAEDYWVDGEALRLSVAGGEFAIHREQVQSVVELQALPEKKSPPPVATEPVQDKTPKPAGPQSGKESVLPPTPQAPQARPAPVEPQQTPPSPEELKAGQRAEEERQYQERVRTVTERIKTLMDRYALATRGQSGPDPTLLKTQEAIDARTADLLSRMKDAEHRTGAVQRVTPPLAPYTVKEKELSDLRSQINDLENQRSRLIDEMQRKNFNIGSLFLP